jgi:hypothetical protein
MKLFPGRHYRFEKKVSVVIAARTVAYSWKPGHKVKTELA